MGAGDGGSYERAGGGDVAGARARERHFGGERCVHAHTHLLAIRVLVRRLLLFLAFHHGCTRYPAFIYLFTYQSLCYPTCPGMKLLHVVFVSLVVCIRALTNETSRNINNLAN